MKKNFLTILVVLVSFVLLFSCKDKDKIDPGNQDNTNQTLTCDAKAAKANFNLTKLSSKDWVIKYFDANTGEQITNPLVLTEGNLITFTAAGRLTEWIGITKDPVAVMDTGTYVMKNCGKEIVLNTNLSGGPNPFVFEKLTADYMQGIIYIQITGDGSLLKTRIIGYPYRKKL